MGPRPARARVFDDSHVFDSHVFESAGNPIAGSQSLTHNKEASNGMLRYDCEGPAAAWPAGMSFGFAASSSSLARARHAFLWPGQAAAPHAAPQ